MSKIVVGETQVRVHEVKRGGEVGEYLYTGTYMGIGSRNLGLNGQEEAIIVASPVDDEHSQLTLHSFKGCFFVTGEEH
jgi:hypothetical protein